MQQILSTMRRAIADYRMIADGDSIAVGLSGGKDSVALVAALAPTTGWSKATVFMMLKRLIAKGAVSLDESGKYQQYSAAVAYAEVEPEETASFLTKVYGGSVGLMVSNLVGRGALSEQEIRELKAILDAAEQQED